jgi:hypothetical protein
MKPGEKIRIVQTDGDTIVWDKVFVLQGQDQLPSVIIPPIMDVPDTGKETACKISFDRKNKRTNFVFGDINASNISCGTMLYGQER